MKVIFKNGRLVGTNSFYLESILKVITFKSRYLCNYEFLFRQNKIPELFDQTS